jgi:hypothetical protein
MSPAPEPNESPDPPERNDVTERPSGLRNPRRAVRGVAAAALAIEAIVLLLAIQPMRVLGVPLTGVAVGVIVGLALASLVVAGLLRYRWAWWAAAGVQVAVFAAGFVFHGSLVVLGVVFGSVWAYVLHVRRTVLGADRF